MALNYTMYQYDDSRNAVVMTDMDGKELAITVIGKRHRLYLMSRRMLGFLSDLQEKNLQVM